MELIIKPTGKCDFSCTFCSAANLDVAHPVDGVPEKIKDLIKVLRPKNIIITGGEPLMVDPAYYLELQEFSKCHISFTTNLKDFYLNPDKWADILSQEKFGIITSFNYGDTRRWDKDTPYTEEQFIEVMNLFKSVTGKKYLPFIATIDENNEHRLLDHVYLAKRLDSKVKINGATKIGRQGKNYPKYKIIQAYLNIINLGLGEYELTCHDRQSGRCSFNINLMCNTAIRCCYVDSLGELHYGICDDEISAGRELKREKTFPIIPLPTVPKRLEHITTKCVQCKLFRFCNGCNSHRRHAKEFPEYCSEMLKMEDEIIRTGWAL